MQRPRPSAQARPQRVPPRNCRCTCAGAYRRRLRAPHAALFSRCMAAALRRAGRDRRYERRVRAAVGGGTAAGIGSRRWKLAVLLQVREGVQDAACTARGSRQHSDGRLAPARALGGHAYDGAAVYRPRSLIAGTPVSCPFTYTHTHTHTHTHTPTRTRAPPPAFSPIFRCARPHASLPCEPPLACQLALGTADRAGRRSVCRGVCARVPEWARRCSVSNMLRSYRRSSGF